MHGSRLPPFNPALPMVVDGGGVLSLLGEQLGVLSVALVVVGS